MKIKCVKLEDCIGKTVTGADRDGAYNLFRFTDGSVLAFRSESHEPGEAWAFALSEINLEIDDCRRAAYRAGIINKKQFGRLNEKARKTYTDKRREQYESFKREFGAAQ